MVKEPMEIWSIQMKKKNKAILLEPRTCVLSNTNKELFLKKKISNNIYSVNCTEIPLKWLVLHSSEIILH